MLRDSYFRIASKDMELRTQRVVDLIPSCASREQANFQYPQAAKFSHNLINFDFFAVQELAR